jgi:hypothetical protein
LSDDTTTVIVEIFEENQIEKLKTNFKIPDVLNTNDVIDEYILKKINSK